MPSDIPAKLVVRRISAFSAGGLSPLDAEAVVDTVGLPSVGIVLPRSLGPLAGYPCGILCLSHGDIMDASTRITP